MSCNDVAKEMVRVVGRVGSQFTIMKHLDKLKGKNRWQFIVKAPEKSLQDTFADSSGLQWQHSRAW